MTSAYLPSSVRDRLQDLMKQHKITQSELATKIDSTVSVISRFLTGKTDKLSDELIIKIANVFNVSSDFLLGITDIPDRKNYEISELGLSVKAAKNLYTGKLNPYVINCLLENPRFAELTYLIEQYLNDALSSGFAAQNQLYSSVFSMLKSNYPTEIKAIKEIPRLKTSVYQTELSNIQNQFMAVIKELKKDIGSDFTDVQMLNKIAAQEMFDKLTKGQNEKKPSITPEQLTNAIISSISGMDGVKSDALDKFGQAFLELIKSTNDANNEKSNE